MNRSEVLLKAEECVNGKRQQYYGTPEDNFGRICELWKAYFGDCNPHDQLTDIDVAMLMILLKVARIRANENQPDSYVDIAGYAACAGEIASNKFNKNKEDATNEINPDIVEAMEKLRAGLTDIFVDKIGSIFGTSSNDT